MIPQNHPSNYYIKASTDRADELVSLFTCSYVNILQSPCVYRILNLKNNKVYVGSTSNGKRRFFSHKTLLNSNKHRSSMLMQDYHKYGAENFVFHVIMKFPKRINRKELVKVEYDFINGLQAEYNVYKNKKQYA